METKKNLWGCGHPPSKKKRSSKKDSSSLNQSSSNDHANLATSLIKFVKKRCSSFTVTRRRKRPDQEKKQTVSASASASYKKHPGTNLVTLQEWMSADMTTGSSGEFHVFKQVAFYKKIHPSFDHRSNRDVDGQISRKQSCNMDHMSEKLISVDGGAAVVEGGLSPPHQSSGDTSKKRVRFRLPLVTNIFLLESPDRKE